jgi:hypothetical protein
VPTQTFFEFDGSIATAPIDCTGCLSNTGVNVVPPFTDFHTPPLADPMNIVSRPFSRTASSAAIRPLIVAEPIFRAGKPEIVAESYFPVVGCCCAPATHALSNMPEINIHFEFRNALAIMYQQSFRRRCFVMPLTSVSRRRYFFLG